MSKMTVAAGLVVGGLVGAAVAVTLHPGAANQPRVAASYPTELSLMEAIRGGGVPCATDSRYGKYPRYACTLNGHMLNVVSKAHGGPDNLPRGPLLQGPNWYITTGRVADLVRVRDAVGGDLLIEGTPVSVPLAPGGMAGYTPPCRILPDPRGGSYGVSLDAQGNCPAR